MFSGSLKICRSFRNRTGPTVGSMLSAMHASVEFINSCRGRRCRPREANSFPYKKSKTEFRRRPARRRRRLSAAEQVYSDAILARLRRLPLRHRLRRGDDRQAIASFRRSRAACSAFVRFVCRPRCPIGDGLRQPEPSDLYFDNSDEKQVEYQINSRIGRQLTSQCRNRQPIYLENEVHMNSAIKQAESVGEMSLCNFLQLFDFDALFFSFGF